MATADPPETEQQLGDLVEALIQRLPAPHGPRPEAPPRRGPVEQDPLVRRVLAAFPGAIIVSTKEIDREH